MSTWKKLDIGGRAIILLAILVQLSALGSFQEEKDKNDIFYILENQAWMADMIQSLASTKPKGEIADSVSEAKSRITLFSEREKNIWQKYVRRINQLFVVLFLVGATISLIGRYQELKEG